MELSCLYRTFDQGVFWIEAEVTVWMGGSDGIVRIRPYGIRGNGNICCNRSAAACSCGSPDRCG